MVTITPTGFSPLEVTIAVGGTVTFVNSDRFGHEIWGGLDHNSRDCPEVEEAGFLTPNQRKDTAVFATAKVCRFHDHTNIGNPAYQGRIIVQNQELTLISRERLSALTGLASSMTTLVC